MVQYKMSEAAENEETVLGKYVFNSGESDEFGMRLIIEVSKMPGYYFINIVLYTAILLAVIAGILLFFIYIW